MDSIAVPQHAKTPCRSDPDLWLSDGPRAQQRAKARCLSECADATRKWCLREALSSGDPVGVYGGTTPSEREAMKESAA